mmetsp:Transcript_68995/g.180837  ORF Transcript_68995/g.180837 Transcript_68995/m.180837 type:complete len:272 (-) Transcript_68995:555-1370(-)
MPNNSPPPQRKGQPPPSSFGLAAASSSWTSSMIIAIAITIDASTFAPTMTWYLFSLSVWKYPLPTVATTAPSRLLKLYCRSLKEPSAFSTAPPPSPSKKNSKVSVKAISAFETFPNFCPLALYTSYVGVMAIISRSSVQISAPEEEETVILSHTGMPAGRGMRLPPPTFRMSWPVGLLTSKSSPPMDRPFSSSSYAVMEACTSSASSGATPAGIGGEAAFGISMPRASSSRSGSDSPAPPSTLFSSSCTSSITTAMASTRDASTWGATITW